MNQPIEEYGIEMILLDEEKQQIQASVYKNLLSKFDAAIEEGKVYKFSRFKTGANYGTEKATTHSCRLFMEFTTRVENHKELPIPIYDFKFRSFDDIIHENIPCGQFFDLIGEFYEYHPIIDTNGGYRKTKIDIKNNENQIVTCNVWGTHCNEICQIVTKYKQQKPIIILQGVMLSYYGGELLLQTTKGGTKFHINLDIEEVNSFQAM
ncbi:hypothetical protein vseg_010867 [Gypsophila vaccaria]